MRIDIPTLFRLWSDLSLSKEQICSTLGVTRGELARLGDRHKLPPRPRRRGADGVSIDPTPEQIAERAAEVRKTWTASVEQQRRGAAQTGWRAPRYEYDSTTGIFSY